MKGKCVSPRPSAENNTFTHGSAEVYTAILVTSQFPTPRTVSHLTKPQPLPADTVWLGNGGSNPPTLLANTAWLGADGSSLEGGIGGHSVTEFHMLQVLQGWWSVRIEGCRGGHPRFG